MLSSILYNNEPFLHRIVACDEKWILFNNQQWPAQWLDQEEAPKHFPKLTYTKKRSWSLCGLLSVWSTTAFWIPAKPLNLRNMLSKSMRCTENCNACSWHWSTEWAQFFSTTAPNHMLHNQHFKSWMNWAMKLYLISHTHLTSCWLPLLQAYRQCFAGRTLPQPVGCRKCFPEFVKFQSIDFLRWKNKQPYFSLAKMCWL